MALSWNESRTGPDPFEASVGDGFAYTVHLAGSDAVSDDEIERDLAETVHRALPFARAATGERAAKWLLLWDVVEADLTVVSSDESMMHDAEHVVKCHFDSLEAEGRDASIDDFDEVASRRSATIRTMLERIVAGIDAVDLPAGVPVLYSDEDRGSVGAEGFAAEVTLLRAAP